MNCDLSQILFRTIFSTFLFFPQIHITVQHCQSMKLAPLSVFIYVKTLKYVSNRGGRSVSFVSSPACPPYLDSNRGAHIFLSIAHETFRPKKIFCQKEGIGEKISIYFSAAFVNSTSHDLAKKTQRSSHEIYKFTPSTEMDKRLSILYSRPSTRWSHEARFTQPNAHVCMKPLKSLQICE